MRLEDYRRARELTRNQLSKELKITYPTLLKYLNGEMVNKTVAIRISEYTGGLVTIEDLLFNRSPEINIMKAVKFYLENHPEGMEDQYVINKRSKKSYPIPC